MESVLKILLVEDNPGDADIIIELLSETKLNKSIIQQADNLKDTLALLSKDTFDILLLDLGLPDSSGLSGLKKSIAVNSDIPIVVVSGQDDLTISEEAIQFGAEDYLIKGKIDDEILTRVVLYSIERKKQKRELKAVNQQLQASEQQLQAAIQQLTADEQQLKAFNQQLLASEQAIRESEEKFRLLAENSVDCIWTLDKMLRFTYLSPSLELMTGFKPEEWIGTHLSKHFTKREFLKVGMLAAKALKNYRTFKSITFETKMLDNKGNEIDFEISSSILRDQKGKLLGLQGNMRDITERKKAEEKMRESEKLMSKIAENYPNSYISIIEKDFTIGFTSGQEFKHQNLNPDEFVGLNIEQVFGENTPLIKDYYKKTFKGEGQSFELFINNQYQHYRTTPLYSEDGTIQRILAVVENITERKLAEEQVRQSALKWQSTFNSITDIILVISKDHKISEINQAGCEALGLEHDDIIGKKCFEIVHGTESPIKECPCVCVFESKKMEVSEYTQNGRQYLLTAWPILDEDGNVASFSHSIKDITKSKQAEQELIEAKEKAEESNRLKTAFLNNMSHEIRTPLNGITGFIGLLQDSEIADEEKQHYFDIINKSSDRLIATVTDIIDISRIEAGEVKISKTEVSVNDILEEQYSFFNHQAQSKGLELIYKPGLSDKEARFVTDKHKLEGILANLIKNAIKFTDHGEITLACSLKKEQDMDVLEFFVKDTGIGIPANRTEAIFNRFEQADIEDKRAHQGSGLGLAIAKSYIEMMGGEISVSSEVGKGSTFTFSLPYTKQFAKESYDNDNINKETQTALSNLSVIIAEDDEVNIMYFDAIFKTKFKNIIYTKTGKETIEKCKENPETDLILMDIKMPGMNGYDATREIRKFNSDVIIFAQTAFGLSGDKEKAIEAGCNDYISKPINKAELKTLIQKYFEE